MAEQVEVPIITASAVTNLAELKQGISDAKKALDGMTLGTDEYRDKLKDLIEMQNLMRGAMNGTTANMEDLKAAADGTSVTYNGLVNQMANAKRELRNLDLSTKAGRERFQELSAEIKNTNDALKELDEKQGSYVRNVGNYTSGLKNLGEILKNNVPALSATARGIGDVDKAVHLLGQQPILGIIGLLAPLLTQIANGLKEDKGAMDSVKKAMDALKPITDFFAGILQQIVDVLGDLISKAADFLGSSGIINQVIQGVAGVGNAILKFVVAPFKGVIEAIKVFKEQGVKGFREAGQAFANEMKNGVAFKSNYEAGQGAADAMIKGMASKRKAAKAAGNALGKDVAEGIKEEIDLEKIWADAMKRYEDKKKEKAENSAFLDSVLAEQVALADAEVDAYIAALERAEEEEKFYNEAMVEDAKRTAERKAEAMAAYAGAVSELLTSVADAMEAGTDVSEAEERKAKNLRIAAATIDMLQGAVTAFSVAQQLGPVAGPIVGAINAAAVIATGLANIAKIKATNVSKNSGSSTSATAPAAPATVQAPALTNAVPTTTVVNGASTESALNGAARPQRVYILQSDIEAAGETSRVQVAESSF